MELRRRDELERLFRAHGGEIHRYVARRMASRDDADDVVQDAFLNALRALERGTRPDNPRSWLFTIAENVRRRRLRRESRARALEDAAAIVAPPASTESQDLIAALRELPPSQREALLLRDVGGFSYDEVAARVGSSTSAVRMLLFRARRALRDGLSVLAPVGRILERLGGADSPVVGVAARAAGAVAVLAVAGGTIAAAGPADRTRPSHAASRVSAQSSSRHMTHAVAPAVATGTSSRRSAVLGAETAPARRFLDPSLPAPSTPASPAPASTAAASPVPAMGAQPQSAQPQSTSPAVASAAPAAPTAPAPPAPAPAPAPAPTASSLPLPSAPAVPQAPAAPAPPAVDPAPPAVPTAPAPPQVPALPPAPTLPPVPPLPTVGG